MIRARHAVPRRARAGLPVALAVALAGLCCAAPPSAEAAFRYRGTAAQPSPHERPGGEIGPASECGYASASGRDAGTAAADGRYSFWLRCGEPLVAALARWGAAHGVMVVQPPGLHDWRIVMPYRFRAAGFAGAIEQLRTHLQQHRPRPVLRFDAANRVLVILGEGGRQ